MYSTHLIPYISGHISVAEIFLTDLCESEEAPTVCKHHLDKAIETRPNSAEAHQLLASWCISMIDDDEADEKFEEAKKAIKTSVLLWLPQYQVGIMNQSAFGGRCSLSSKKRKHCRLTHFGLRE